MDEFIVKDFTCKQLNRSLFRTDPQEIATAIVTFPGHGWIGVSRWQDEDYWVVDARFGENSYPFFSNGEGSRCVGVSVLAEDHEVTKALNAMYEAAREATTT